MSKWIADVGETASIMDCDRNQKLIYGRKYHSYELEVLAVVGALKKFLTYLSSWYELQDSNIDCAAYTMAMDKKDLATSIAR